MRPPAAASLRELFEPLWHLAPLSRRLRSQNATFDEVPGFKGDFASKDDQSTGMKHARMRVPLNFIPRLQLLPGGMRLLDRWDATSSVNPLRLMPNDWLSASEANEQNTLAF